MKISVYIAVSLDGYIARADGGLDWLPQPGDPGIDPDEDYGYAAFMADVDTLVMGRNTFETVLGFGVEWPYEGTPLVVLSNRPVTIPPELTGKVSAMGGTPAEIAAALAAQGVQHIYLDGGVTIQAFLRAGLVDEMIITTIPVLLGDGLPLFGPLDEDIRLQHRETRGWANGMVQSHYEIKPT